MTAYRFEVLGPPRLAADGDERLPRRRKELSLLASVALRGRPVSRSWLATAFWGDRDEERARHSLRQTLVRLKEALPGGILVDADQVSLAPGAVEVDAAVFEADVAAGRWEAAVERWRGELLEGCDAAGSAEFAAWLDGERARLGALHAAALRRLADDALAGARWGQAAEWAARWSHARPLDADAGAAWVRALSLAGRAEEAAARHAELTARWRDAFEGELPAGWQALGESLARTRPAPTPAAADAPPSASLRTPERVGRDDEFAALRSAWTRAAEGAGVAVIVDGEPGCGRTRFCADFATAVAERGDAWICAAHGRGAVAAGPWSVARELLAGLERAPGLGGAADWALAETSRLVPALRERFRALPPASGDDAVLPDAVARVLADVAAEVPVLVYVDDVGEADEGSRRLLLALARRPGDGVMVLLTGRAGELDVPRAVHLPLRPLSAGETEALVAGMADLSPEDRARLAAHVYAESAGNPGLAVGRVRALADDGTLARGADGGWVLSPRALETSAPPLAGEWAFVARAAELRRLEAALDAAVAGSGRVAWIAGEAGIGKTALLRELGLRARRRHPGVLVAAGECDAYAGPGSPYLPFRELWRAVRQAERAAADVPDPFAPSSTGGSIDERCTEAFRRVAAIRPLLLVVDDAQWIDATSAGLLFHLSRRIGDAPVLLVTAYRDNDVAAAGDHPLAGVVSEWERLFGGAGMRLQPLRNPDGARLVDALLEGGADGLSPAFRAALLRHTEGHPLFVVEAVRDLQARGVIVQDGDGRWTDAGAPEWSALPARVEGVIGERIRRLDEVQGRILAIAAAEGEVFTAEVVAAVLDTAPHGVVRRLGELDRAHRLVAPHGLRRVAAGTVSEYRFRHSLFHRHAATLTDAAERRYLHAGVGAALERLYGEGSAEAAPRLARHFAEAHDDVRAARYLHLAGAAAAQAGAHDTASELFARALEHAVRAGDADAQARIREAAADVRAAAGDPADADAEYRALLSSVDARTRVRLLRKQGDARQARQQVEPALEAYGAAETALFDAPEWESADFAEWAQLQVGRARALLLLGRMDELQELVHSVKDGVERYGRPGERTAVLATLLRELSRRERLFGLDALVAACRKFAAEAEGPGRLREQAGAEFTIGFTQLWRGRLDDAEAHFAASLKVAEEGEETWRQVLCCTYLGLVRRLSNDVDGAVEWTRRARDLGELTRGAAGMVHANAAWAALRSGDPRRAAADASAALAQWSGVSPVYPFQWAARWPLLSIALSDGQDADAIGHARAMLDPEQHPLPDPICRPLTLAVESWERGDADDARAHLQAASDAARVGGYI